MPGLTTLTFLIAVIGTGLLRHRALARGLLDVPNERSSHTVATPRGGGAAIVFAVLLALTVLFGRGRIQWSLFAALAGGGGAVAVIGYLDDRYQLRTSVRLAVHFGAAIWAIYSLGGLPPVQFAHQVVSFGAAGYVLGALGIVWALNLFNFMDGIDGIAASEAGFVSWSAALLVAVNSGSTSSTVASASLIFGAACVGFLVWNWPPAKIFMGDVGSGFLGYVIAVLAVAAARDNPIAPLVWLILGGVFFVDATVTLCRRLARGERAYVAHRSHAYQWLARRWQSHWLVTLSVLFVNFFWVLPCAWLATVYPTWAGWMVVVALTPITIAALAAGAGRPEARFEK